MKWLKERLLEQAGREANEDVEMPPEKPGVEIAEPYDDEARRKSDDGETRIKSLFARADKEPDASWHRPSVHKPGAGPVFKKPEPHVYNPDVECPEDMPPEKKTDEKTPTNTNKSCHHNGQMYVVRNGNVYNYQGRLVTDSAIKNAVIQKCVL